MALAESVKQQLAVEVPEDANGGSISGSSSSNSGGGSSSSGSSGRLGKAAVLAQLPEAQLVPGVLLSLSVACSMNGHYDAELLDQLAGQVGTCCCC